MAPLLDEKHPCAVSGCSDPTRRRGETLLCDHHASAPAVEVGGETVRFCIGCRALHALPEFVGAKHVCRRKEQYVAGLVRRSHQEQMILKQRNVLHRFEWVEGLVEAYCRCFWWGQQRRDPGRKIWAAGLFSVLRGETATSQMGIAAFYPTACWLMGWRKAETWIAVVGAFVNLHIIMPYAHRHFYVASINAVREAAQERGLAVSQSFRLLDDAKHAKYEAYVQQGSRLLHSFESAAIFAFAGAFCLQAAWAAYKAYALSPIWGVAGLLLTGGVFFPLRARLVTLGKRGPRQMLDTGVLMASQLIFTIPLFYGWMTGTHQCGTPEALLAADAEQRLAIYGTVFEMAYSAIQTALVECPFPQVLVMELVVGLSRAMVTPITFWCITAETGRAFSNVVPNIFSLNLLLAATACSVMRILMEKRKLLAYLHRLPFKHGGGNESRIEDEDCQPFLRLSAKMWGATIADLPDDLQQRILSAVRAEPLSMIGAVRPGCVFLTLAMRFSNWAQRQAAQSSLLGYAQWASALLGRTADTGRISMNLQGRAYNVEEGSAPWEVLPDMQAPFIESIEPMVVTPNCSTVTLWVAALGACTDFKVLLQTDSGYHELTVYPTGQPAAHNRELTAVVARLPEGEEPGLGWLEMLVETEKEDLVLSEGFPVLFTPLLEVANDFSDFMMANNTESPQQLASFFADLSNCLHFVSSVSPSLLLKVIKLGLPECFKLLADRKLLLAADRQGQGLLGTAAQSNSEIMVMEVISALRRHSLRPDPCKLAPDARGFSALHWAAHHGNFEIVYVLLSEVPSPWQSWGQLPSRRSGTTPAEVMEESEPAFIIYEDMLPPPGAAVLPPCLPEDNSDCQSSDARCGSMASGATCSSKGSSSSACCTSGKNPPSGGPGFGGFVGLVFSVDLLLLAIHVAIFAVFLSMVDLAGRSDMRITLCLAMGCLFAQGLAVVGCRIHRSSSVN